MGRSRRRWARGVGMLAAGALLLASCGQGGSADPDENVVIPAQDDDPEPDPDPDPDPEPTDDPDEGQPAELAAVRAATFYITAEGEFYRFAGTDSSGNPIEPGWLRGAGTGTGFLIGADGTALTNHHVVTGASTLTAKFNDEDGSRAMKVVGASECYDLALVKVDGSGLPAPLDWYDGETWAGMDVFAAGYPLSDPEYTFAGGTLSKVRADGDTPWSSMDHTHEHTALIRRGNSGGPLVTPDGRIVGVNYSVDDANRRGFAIPKAMVEEILTDLTDGNSVQWTGINANAFVTDDGEASGVQVSSVDLGSPAEQAGLQGGDVIVTLANLPLATDATQRSYCDILRSHSPDTPLEMLVVRTTTDEVLSGQINGRPLEVVQQRESPDGGQAEAPTESEPWEFFAAIDNDACRNASEMADPLPGLRTVIECSWQTVAASFARWEDHTAVAGTFERTQQARPGGTVTTWHLGDGNPVGFLYEYLADGRAHVLWTYDAAPLTGHAAWADDDFDALYAWWSAVGVVVH